ncbi:DUF3667 domain-containing protein [Croceimicrobium hydrocarbonivorans]|uniref:DUF3667 domain-containing protein n=1 Tax=Croceimicrobium hydrocarbonivorans TaxID=2761580 RepID=A0A7H0VEN8_9FLAO|nr:DUF3667 domain-containing protein [Croceimicrobium hydrocarbonivorans]QNR24186.1 DUF3667 domain-containing protein [Croceimicrobium hydrocarbonivorans]
MSQTPKFLVKQERQVRRYSFRNMGGSILDAFNLEYGILFTLKELLLRPGASIRSYLQEGRLKYTSPFRLLILSTAILLLLFQSSEVASDFQEGFNYGANQNAEAGVEASKVDGAKSAAKVYELFSEYFNLLLWFYIPVISLFSWLFNLKRDLNFAEHIVFNSFYTSLINVFSLIMLLEFALGNELTGILYILLAFVYYMWFYKDLFEKSWLRSFWESIAVSVISALIYIFLIAILMALAIQKGLIPLD